MKKQKNKKWKVEFSEEIRKRLDDLPEDVYNKLTGIVKGFKTGELDPEKIGQPMDLVELEIKLICPECKSENVKWFLDRNSNEVDFHCLECEKSFWMTYKDYKRAISRNPDKIAKH